MTITEIAQYAAQAGPDAADRPAFDSSPNGMAFRIGLMATMRGITVSELKSGRGYTYTLNRQFKINMKPLVPTLTRLF